MKTISYIRQRMSAIVGNALAGRILTEKELAEYKKLQRLMDEHNKAMEYKKKLEVTLYN